MLTYDQMQLALGAREKPKRRNKKFYSRPEAPSEYQLHCQVAEYLTWALPQDAFFTTVENSNHMGGSIGARLQAKDRRKGVKAGFPDILIIYTGKAFLIELKVLGNIPTERQLRVHGEIANAGSDVFVAHETKEVEIALDAWKIPVKARLANG